MQDIDDYYPHIGEYGRFQKILLWTILLPILIPSCFTTFNQIFMSDVPNHWCRVPDLELLLNDSEKRRMLSIPLAEGYNNYEKCWRYKVNWTEIIRENISLPNASWPVESCIDGWEYNTTEVSSSVAIDFDLVCNKSIYPTIGLSFLNMGGPLGIFCFGLINDRFGRKFSLLVCLTVTILSNTLSAFAPNIVFWMITRLFLGTTIPALYHIVFILALEIVGKKYRTWISLMSCFTFTFGLMALSAITYLIPHWRYMTILTAAPFSVYIFVLCFIPESPRWLMARNHHKEAVKVMKNIARINKRQLKDSFMDLKDMAPLQSGSLECSKKKNINILDFFRSPNMRMKTILISYNWFVNEIVYIGLSYYSPSLGSEKHLSFFLSALVEIPGNLLCKYMMDAWGRKLPIFVLMIISGVFCIITVFLPKDAVIAIMVIFLISKFAISASFLIMYTYAGELYPTDARGLGLAVSAYCSAVGRVFLPFVTYLGSDDLALPLVILGILSVIGGTLSLRLPETLNQSLPQTIAEGEEFGKDLSFSNCWKFLK
ncbi:carcinine transporter-like [Cimex lectularius]|uniref:Major facilitator superfamily (MFS) profile domain-containing protein n=1 Tax=Cimex lectularius TaxID=79782 RepID=A0A8I6SJX5_CIMLE|nr:carcinine transporter-like [Cimex lectularius]